MTRDPREISQSLPPHPEASADLGFATVDLDRARRTGFPEVVMGEGKTPDQTAQIALRIFDASKMVLVTRFQSRRFRGGQGTRTFGTLYRNLRRHLGG